MSFTYQGPLHPPKAPCTGPNPLFHGRQQELRILTDACLAEVINYYIVYGSGQSGKTSLLLHLQQRLRQLTAEKDEAARVYPCWADFQRVSSYSFPNLCHFLADEILKNIPGLRGYKVPKTFGSGGPLFDEWLYDLPLKGSRIVLLLEELAFQLPETRPELGKFLRSVFNTGTQRIAVVLFGGIELLKMTTEEVENLHTIFQTVYLPDLSPDATRSVLAAGLGLTEHTAEREAGFQGMSESIYDQAAGHPYFTQHIGALLSTDTPPTGPFPGVKQVAARARQLVDGKGKTYYYTPLFRAIRDNDLMKDCRRLLDSSPCSGHGPAMAKLRLLGVAKPVGEVWTVRNQLLERELKTWLAETDDSHLGEETLPMSKILVLDPQDDAALRKLLVSVPILATERGREGIVASASLEDVRCLLDLGGPPAVAIPLLVKALRAYGRVNYDQHALGRFLSAVAGVVGQEDAEFINGLIEKYGLMVPASKAPVVTNWKTPTSQQDFLEKIVGENTLRPIAFLEQGIEASRSVVYIEVHSMGKGWSGTGFLVSPRLVITNHHVIPKRGLLTETTFRFNYQIDTRGNTALPEDYKARPNGIYESNPALDYAIVELDGEPGTKWGLLEVTCQVSPMDSRVNIIQHPNGLPKQVSLQNNFVKYADAKLLQYVTSTLPGSSGSPVFNDHWQVVALHHAGGLLKEGEAGATFFRNEGILLSAILRDLPDEVVAQLTVR